MNILKLDADWTKFIKSFVKKTLSNISVLILINLQQINVNPGLVHETDIDRWRCKKNPKGKKGSSCAD